MPCPSLLLYNTFLNATGVQEGSSLTLVHFERYCLAPSDSPQSPAMFPLIFHTACAQQILRVQNFSDDAQFCAQCKIGDDRNQLNSQNNFLLC